MIPIGFVFGDKGAAWRAGVDQKYYDPQGEDICREMIARGMKDYKVCQSIMKAIGHIPVNIMCNKGVGNWFDDETNTVWFDRDHKGLPHLVDKGKDHTVPALVCLFHELGHAKQFHENKIWYQSAVKTKDAMGVAYQIEYDNLQKHEDPLMREMGLPIRKRYEFYVTEAEAEKLLKGGGTTQ